jgi:hypothetical protein
VTWEPRDSVRSWASVASSADGSKLVAAVNDGQLYISTDSGVTWTVHSPPRGWVSVASSADGSKLVGALYLGPLYTSSSSQLVSTSVGVLGSISGVQYDAVDLQCIGPDTFMVRGHEGYLVLQ